MPNFPWQAIDKNTISTPKDATTNAGSGVFFDWPLVTNQNLVHNILTTLHHHGQQTRQAED
ncbi:hypothetical protein C5L39_10150 [Corynebacterium alimapuense]|uniref:Uncharacterized protein n=1 Tax=Corynebacterium alimapuense TaxID=1576874 RepID=A0A3M8K4U6_9CORY|nr:hypothetical protein C5L39_10150 [Corynebacterium alimapuense]